MILALLFHRSPHEHYHCPSCGCMIYGPDAGLCDICRLAKEKQEEEATG